MPARQRQPKGDQFRVARHVEKRDSKRGMYAAAREDFPNQTEFGRSEFVDARGIQYRLAFTSRPLGWTPGTVIPPLSFSERQKIKPQSDGRVKLWVKLDKGSGMKQWFTPSELVGNTTLELLPTSAGLDKQVCVLHSAFRRRPQGRTGAVTGFTIYSLEAK
jgi:hypothetical protein